jgi:hypothetical protein
MLLSFGLPIVFVPFITASYERVPPGKTDRVSALLNAACNSGGSWYERLDKFPAAYCDRNGYVSFQSEEDLRSG